MYIIYWYSNATIIRGALFVISLRIINIIEIY